jgi:hypothetical protein
MKRLAAICALAAATFAIAAPAGGQESHPGAAKALAQAKRAASQPPAAQTPGELTPVLIRLSQALPRLEGDERRIANSILARPDDRRHDRYGDGYTVPEPDASPACAGTFCVHWVRRSKDAPRLRDSNGTTDGDGVPDYVEKVLATGEESFEVENNDLGWTAPEGDGDRGGGTGVDRTDAYLLELDGAYFGYSSPDEGQGGDEHKQAYLVLDNDYREFVGGGLRAIEALQVTFAHEYNHVLQFAYDSREDLWMFEATATWMEEQVYPTINDYRHYLPPFARNSRVPLTRNDITGTKIYGAAVWNHYLAGTGSPDEVRNAWANSDSVDPPHRSVAAYDSVLPGGGGDHAFAALGKKFIEFASVTAEWRSYPGEFPDAAKQPDMKRVAELRRGKAREIRLDHLAYALLKVRPRLAQHDLELRVRAPAGTLSGIDLVGRRGVATSGDLESNPVRLADGGKDTASLAGDDYSRVTAVIVNADARVTSNGHYARDGQRYRVKLVRAD